MEHPDYLEQLYHIVDGLNARFLDGDEPFRIVTRLCEEAGNLASAVNRRAPDAPWSLKGPGPD